jgi:tetratricopeptide (TPR) repeat protein
MNTMNSTNSINPRNYWYIELILIVGIVLLYGWATYERNFVWKDELSLWSDVVKKSPYKARGYNEIGMYYYVRQLPDTAMPFFRKSLFLDPYSGAAHNNIGLYFLTKGLTDAAIEEFRQAIQANPSNGMYHVNLGIAYLGKGMYDLANNEIQLGKDLRRKQKKQSFHQNPQTR